MVFLGLFQQKSVFQAKLVHIGPTFGSWTWQSACTMWFSNSLLHIPVFCIMHIGTSPGHGIPMEKVGVHFHDTYGQAGAKLKLLEAHISLAFVSWLRLMFYSMQQIYSTCPTVSCCWILIACDFNRCWILVDILVTLQVCTVFQAVANTLAVSGSARADRFADL